MPKLKDVQMGFDWSTEEYLREISRRYDINQNERLTIDEAKEWVFCLAPFFDELDLHPNDFDPSKFEKVTSPEAPSCGGTPPTGGLEEVKMILKAFLLCIHCIVLSKTFF